MEIHKYRDLLLISGSVKDKFTEGAIHKIDKNGNLLESKIFKSNTWDSIKNLVNINDREILFLVLKRDLNSIMQVDGILKK